MALEILIKDVPKKKVHFGGEVFLPNFKNNWVKKVIKNMLIVCFTQDKFI